MKQSLIDIRNKIINKKTSTTKEEFIDMYEFFLDNKQNYEKERLEIYTDYTLKYNLSSLAEAKFEILSTQLSNKIYDLANEALEFSYIDIEISSELIKEINDLKNIFKSHDQCNFKEFLALSIEDMTINEINAIFDKKDLTHKDIQQIAQSLKDVISKPVIKSNQKLNFIVNHPLAKLLNIPREEKSFPEEQYEKYANLAEKLKDFYDAKYSESFTGAITYLIHLDYKYGLDNIKENKVFPELSNLLNKIESNTFKKKDMDKLIELSIEKSEQFISKNSQEPTRIKSEVSSKNVRGIMDRRYEDVHIHDGGKNNTSQRNQIARGAELAIQEYNYYPIALQVSTRTPVLHNDEYFTSNLNDKENFIVNYSRNVSGLLSVIANEKRKTNLKLLQNVDIIGNVAEIYTDKVDASVKFFNELNNAKKPEEKLKNYIDSLLHIHNEKLTTNNISNDINYRLNEFVLLPLLSTINSLKVLKKFYPSLEDSYEFGVSLIHKHSENLNRFTAIYKEAENTLDKEPKEVMLEKPVLLKFQNDKARIIGRSVSEIKELLIEHKTDIKINDLSMEEKKYLAQVAKATQGSEELKELFIVYKEIALNNIKNNRANKNTVKRTDSIAILLDKLVAENIEERKVTGFKSSDRLYYLIFNANKDDKKNERMLEELDIIYSLKDITLGKIKVNAILNENKAIQKIKNKKQ